jgi:hypothetical protein
VDTIPCLLTSGSRGFQVHPRTSVHFTRDGRQRYIYISHCEAHLSESCLLKSAHTTKHRHLVPPAQKNQQHISEPRRTSSAQSAPPNKRTIQKKNSVEIESRQVSSGGFEPLSLPSDAYILFAQIRRSEFITPRGSMCIPVNLYVEQR